MFNRSIFDIVNVDSKNKIVFIEDLHNNENASMSVTNDAESVCIKMNNMYPEYRIVYKDTEGVWDELVHEEGIFKRFKNYKHD